MTAVKYIIFVFTIIGLNNLAVAESSTPNPETETSSSSGYCQDCLKKDAVTALGSEIAKYISKHFELKMEEITTRPVDVRRKGQEMLNAVVRVEATVLDKDTGKKISVSGSGTLATRIGENKPCIVITAKHAVCYQSFETMKDGTVSRSMMSNEECTAPKRRVLVDAGKTRDPLGDGFDFEGLSALVVAVGRYKYEGGISDWAVLKLDKPKGSKGFPKNFPRPMEIAFDSDGSPYTDLDIVSAGYPGYGGAKKLYADWKCKSSFASYNAALVDCEVHRGMSGGPIVAFTDSKEPLLVGINSSGNAFMRKDGVETVSTSRIVTFERKTAVDLENSDGSRIMRAIDNIRCD